MQATEETRVMFQGRECLLGEAAASEAIPLDEWRKIHELTGEDSGFIHQVRWRTVEEVFESLLDFVMPKDRRGHRSDMKFRVECYWCSPCFGLERAYKSAMPEGFTVGDIRPNSAVQVSVSQGTESPIVNVGWTYSREVTPYNPDQLRHESQGYFQLAAIKFFCTDDQAWAIAQKIQRAFNE